MIGLSESSPMRLPENVRETIEAAGGWEFVTKATRIPLRTINGYRNGERSPSASNAFILLLMAILRNEIGDNKYLEIVNSVSQEL